MKRALYLVLPRQGVDDPIQPHRDLQLAQGLAVLVEETEVGHHPEWIGHRHDAALDLDPVPCHPRGAVVRRTAPQGLAAAGNLLVAKTQHSGPEVDQMKIGGGVCLTPVSYTHLTLPTNREV